MIEEVKALIDEYVSWLHDQTALREVGEVVEITTPYLDRNNDHVQIYVKKEGDIYIVGDDGYTFADLELSGCELDTPKRKQLLELTLNGFGVKIEDDELVVRTSPENFALRKHSLLQAILAVGDLFYLASPTIASLFLEDVNNWLEVNEIRYIPSVDFTGKSGLVHKFHFAIPKSSSRPERLIRAINNPTRQSAIQMAFAWEDTKEIRPAASEAYAMLNDSESRITAPVRDTLKAYGVQAIPWSRREGIIEKLAA